MKRADYQTEEQISHVLRYDIDPYVRLRFVLTATGLSNSTIYRLIQMGQFPQPRRLTERTSVWRLSEIKQWMADRESSAALAKRG